MIKAYHSVLILDKEFFFMFKQVPIMCPERILQSTPPPSEKKRKNSFTVPHKDKLKECLNTGSPMQNKLWSGWLEGILPRGGDWRFQKSLLASVSRTRRKECTCISLFEELGYQEGRYFKVYYGAVRTSTSTLSVGRSY